MQKKTITLLALIIIAVICLAETPTDEKSPEKTDQEKIKEKIENKEIAIEDMSPELYWVIRSQAMTELIPFLSKTRTEVKGYYKAMTDYLIAHNLGPEYRSSGIKVAYNPAEYAAATGKTEEFVKNNIELPNEPLTWDQVVQVSIEHIIAVGHIPTDVSDDREVEIIQKISKQKEDYAKKIRTEIHKVAQDCLSIKAFLESIDKFDDCKEYSRFMAEEEKMAKAESMRQGREELAEKERNRREMQKQNAWRARQSDLGDRYYRGRRPRHTYNRW